jgi:hypothetical protein
MLFFYSFLRLFIRKTRGSNRTVTLILILAFVLFAPVWGSLFPLQTGAGDGLSDSFTQIFGTYKLGGGSRNGFNYYHIHGNLASDPVNPFWRDTFCTHKDYNSAAGTYFYYYNAVRDDKTNSELLEKILNTGTPVKSGIEMSLDQYRHLRYCIIYTNINHDARGQYAYWTWLAKFIPERYSNFSGSDIWTDEWRTKYFGAKESADFQGLGMIENEATADIGASVDTRLLFNGNNIQDFTLNEGDNMRVGPFRLEWTAGSDPVLAQLNSGPNKNTPPVFSLSSDVSKAVRFYNAANGGSPIASVRLGQDFWLEYNANAGGGTAGITVESLREIAAKVLADQFFIHTNAQNQINVDLQMKRPKYQFSVTYDAPPLSEPGDGEEYDYKRPKVIKQVSVDNKTDDSGDFTDMLGVKLGTNVLHRMTVKSTDPKGTILTFQNTDYDLYPSSLRDAALPTDTTGLNVALVKTKDELRDAISENKNIKLIADIVLGDNWTPAEQADGYKGIFDGNGYKLIGDNNMIKPVFYKTQNAVFYRVQFVGFVMTRDVSVGSQDGNGSSRYLGALVDIFGPSSNYTGKMLDCYIDGTFTVKNETGSTTGKYAGGAVGRAWAEEIYGVKGRINLSAENFSNGSQDTFYEGGLFCYAETKEAFENNELMEGSTILGRSRFAGGLASHVTAPAVRNCKADYTYTDATTANDHHYFGGLLRSLTNCLEVDRNTVNCKYLRHGDVQGAYISRFGGLVGVDNEGSPARVYSNCSVKFTGDIDIKYIGFNYYDNGAAGILCVNNNNATSVTIKNCYTNINLNVADNAAAGIYASSGYKNIGNGRTVIISGCRADGSITAAGPDSVIAGIAVAGPRDADTGSKITGCVAYMTLEGDNVNAQIGGIWANPAGHNSTNVMSVENCLFAGSIPNAGIAATYNIYNCDAGNAVGANNYATTQSAILTLVDPADALTAYGAYTDIHLSPAAVSLEWYKDTLRLNIAMPEPEKNGSDSQTWFLEDVGVNNNVFNLPALVTPYRWPAQRIYVTDYYHTKNTQEFIGNLYVWKNNAFIPLWNAATTSSGIDAFDLSAIAEFYMPPGQDEFVFYYKVPNIQAENSGLGAWRNTVKITPRDNILVGPDGDKKFDWPGDWDDDLVYTDKDIPDYRFNLIKMTTVSDYPMPLDGAAFDLYYSPAVLSDFTGVNVLNFPWSMAKTGLKPSDYLGLDYADMPELKAGSYVLRETDAPANYANNMKREWYLVFSGGKLNIHSQLDLSDVMAPPGEEWIPGQNGKPDTIVYSVHIENDFNPNIPLARVCAEKYTENGAQNILGKTVISPGEMPYFNGAVYGLEKFNEKDNDFRTTGSGNNIVIEGPSYGYGNMLVYGTDINGDPLKNWCDIEPGCYKLTEVRAPDGYVTDPTPIYIHFTDAGDLWVNANNHSGTSNTGLNAEVSFGKVNINVNNADAPTATVRTRDRLPQYRLVLEKYLTTNGAKLPGVVFVLTDAKTGSKSTYTSDANGLLTINFPSENSVYTLHEDIRASQGYAPAADYTFETRNGEFYIKGGPYLPPESKGYNFKIMKGLRDNKYYVIFDPDGAALPIPPEDYGKYDIRGLDDGDALGLISAKLGVPNTVVPPPPGGGGDPPVTPPVDPPPETPTKPPVDPPSEPPEDQPEEPGGTDPNIPPIPSRPGDNLIPGPGENTYIELGDDGTPLGEWHYDEDLGEWIFDEYPPLADSLPQTGGVLEGNGMPMMIGFIVLLIALACLLFRGGNGIRAGKKK